jgi:DNA (cytosine-5)-methyltransferase 1
MEATLFDFPKLEITNKIRLIELFGGIGSQAMALRDIGANFEHYRLVEFDKYAVASYNSIHGTSFETADIRNVHGADLGIVERETFTYIMTYSFPCTDLSVAGKMQGMSKAEWESGNSTRSGLLWEVERILKELPADELPQVLLMENVPQVHAEQNKADFEAWLAFLRSRGYFNFYQDLNAKDYGIPQNRDRCFCVSILSPEFIDYEYPEPIKLEKVMRDYLEDEVDEKYYIKSEKADKLIAELINHEGIRDCDCIDLTLKNPQKNKIANAITAREDRGVSNVAKLGNGVICSRVKEIGFMPHKNGAIHQSNKVYASNGISPCLNGVMETHHNIVKILEEKKNRLKVADGGGYGILITERQICRMTGRNPDNPKSRKSGLPTEQMLEPNAQGLCGALTTVQKDNLVLEENAFFYAGNKKAIPPCAQYKTIYRIRKLTPRECWRLMGYTDTDFDNAEKVNSNSQLYKQAGNAIVKQVLMAIFAQMIPESARQK